MDGPLTPARTRELLTRLGLRPNRRLGQNFLVDGNIVRKSLALAEVAPGDAVVEVGPGLGTLTTALLEAGAEVWAVELDRGLHAHLADSLVPRFPDRLHLLHADAVDRPLGDLPPERAAAAKVVSNLPYAAATPWLDAVLAGPLPRRMVLMLQREAADRYAAAAGTPEFGPISILVQSACDVAVGHRVAAVCFFPRPDVESVLLVLHRRASPYVFPAPFRSLLRAVFTQRRKQLGAVLRGAAGPEEAARLLAILAARGFPPTSRAEQIPAALWREMAGAAPPA